MGPGSGAHCDLGLLLNNSKGVTGVEGLTFEYWLKVLLTGLTAISLRSLLGGDIIIPRGTEIH